MSKVVTSFFTLILLTFMLSFTVSRLGRCDQVPPQNQHSGYTDMTGAEINDEINCKGLEKDECLFRRSLAAHLDYIYTQKQQP
ncbi:hypothetical protein BVRB_1g014760 [Beta vulgaris subsp. vulgaris]|nr:hypothetical protein BVRB_1g014760 [Beta vulgaris subsp. vulgaris]